MDTKMANAFPFDTADRLEDLVDLKRYPSLDGFLRSQPPARDIVRADYEVSRQFLLNYADVSGTYNRFRSEIQRFLNYLWVVAHQSLAQMNIETVNGYYKTLKKPPKAWTSRGIHAAFEDDGDQRRANPKWRPFVIRSTDEDVRYRVSQASLNATNTALQTWFNSLVVRGHIAKIPLLHLRKRTRKASPMKENSQETEVRRLTDWQWSYLLETLTQAASDSPSMSVICWWW